LYDIELFYILIIKMHGGFCVKNLEISHNFEDIEERKGQHIKLCLEAGSQAVASVFDSYQLPYTALPEISMDEVSTECDFFGTRLKMPLMIASMTGGSEHGRLINTNLAIAAEKCGVAMGLGSQRIGLEMPEAEETFRLVRKHAPNAFIVANMGAVQLNYGHAISSYQAVVDMVQANALYLHLNPLQEALQPGGDVNFSGLLDKINSLINRISVPVFVKEVGHGISKDNAQALFEAGVSAIDVAGVGGTSYAWVEAKRAKNDDFAAWFKDFGIPTDQAIEQIAQLKRDKNTSIIASGGLRSPVDGLVSRALGADIFSAAVPFLQPAMNESPDDTIATIENWKKGLQVAMFACGVSNWQDAGDITVTKK
jgi:isopentenyl-diphosphate Delta-isomerase